MKFLCGNCKAKYQIADEKVTGRTLRMKCRRCGHDILIDGHNMPQASAPHPTPQPQSQPRRTGSTVSVMPGPGRAGSGAHPMPSRGGGGGGGGGGGAAGAAAPSLPRPLAARGKPPNALSADFRRHVAAPPEVPQRSAPYDMWHVAIQDVPVGPMTRDELARKVESGAVSADSLCWREGMDDWRALGELPELAQVLRRGRDAGRPQRGARSASHQHSRSAPLPVMDEPDDDEGAEPTRVTDFSPFSPAAQGQVDPFPVPASAQATASSAKIMAPTSAVTSAPVIAAEPATPSAPSRGPSGVTTGIAIGALITLLLVGGPALYKATWGSSTKTPDQAPAASAPVERARPATNDTLDLGPEVNDAPSEAAPAQPAARNTGKSTARVAKPDTSDKAAPAGKTMSDEQRRLLERMGASVNDPDLSGVKRPAGESSGGGGALAPSLTPQQLTKVVQDNKTQLQRCYETALRASGGKQDAAIKISVNVVVGGSGTTKSVSTQGDGLGNMVDCIRGAVKRWRFPQSGGESEFAFPLVFQPGA
jgi:predicted Zn finger-like uncharacterized protein